MSATVVKTFDPLEPEGAEELYRRLDAAEPRRVPRAELDGHVGLTSRELYELGCTLEPLTATWVLIASYLALRAARRVRDPFSL